MTLWLEHQYNLTALGAGLVYIAMVVPSFFASPFAGWVSGVDSMRSSASLLTRALHRHPTSTEPSGSQYSDWLSPCRLSRSSSSPVRSKSPP